MTHRGNTRSSARKVVDSLHIAACAFAVAAAALVPAAAATAAPTPSSHPDCPPIPGADKALRPGTVVLIGEIHGTRESPDFVRSLACRAAATGLPVVVGVEIDGGEQDRIDAFLRSSGDAASRQALLAGEAWGSTSQWGVTSEAMVEMLDALRALRRDGADVRVVAFDEQPASDAQARDRGMARRLAKELRTSDRALAVVLSGNVHSRVTRGLPWAQDYEPMGLLLRRELSRRQVLALDVAHGGGTAWICRGNKPCGASELRPRGPQDPEGDRAILWLDAPDDTGHDGWYHVGTLTPAPPAVAPAIPLDGAPPDADAKP